MENAIVWLLVTLVGSFGGAWFGAYFKKKGENYATREDVGELTRVTKGIEAKISDEVWNRQRQWELKRDVLLGAVKRLGACHEAFLQLVIACTARGDTPELVENRIQRSRTFNELSTEFGGSTLLLVNLVC